MIWLFVVALPCYLTYRNDLKAIPKEDLAVPIQDRLFAGFICFPLWMLDFIIIKLVLDKLIIL